MKRIFQLIGYSLLLMLVGILAGCSGSGSTTASTNTGSIKASLVWQEKTSASKAVVQKATAPAGVVTVRVIVSADGDSTFTNPIQQDFAATANTGTISSIPAGTARNVTIQGLDASGVCIYQSVSSGIVITAGQTTDMGTITMAAKVSSTILTVADGYISGGLGPGIAPPFIPLGSTSTKTPYLITFTAIMMSGAPTAVSTSGLPFNDNFASLPKGLAQGTNGYLMVWNEYDSGSNTSYIAGRLIDSTGVPTGSQITIASAAGQGSGIFSESVAFDGTNYLVTWHSGSDPDIKGQFVTQAGSLSGTTFNVSAAVGVQETNGSLIFANGSYFIVYAAGTSGNYNYFIRSISTTGTVSSAVQLNTITSTTWNPTGIAFDGTNLLTLYHIDTTGGGAPVVYIRLISTAMTPLSAEVSRGASSYPAFYGGNPAFDGTKYLVVYNVFGPSASTVYGQHISTNGTPIGAPFVIANNGFGGCVYSSTNTQYVCTYDIYATYTANPQTFFNNVTGVRGVTVAP